MKTVKQYEEEFIETQNNCVCKKCHESFIYKPDAIWWVERGTYSEKLVKCPECGCVNVVKYIDGFNQNPNIDYRYFI